jgi:hypothetical protein
MVERYVRNLTYPQGYERSENAINDYYNTRELELQAQYESRVRDIGAKYVDYEDQLREITIDYSDSTKQINELAQKNEKRLESLDELVDTTTEEEILRTEEELKRLNNEMYDDANAGIIPNMNTASKAEQLEQELKQLKKYSKDEIRENKDIRNEIAEREQRQKDLIKRQQELDKWYISRKNNLETKQFELESKQDVYRQQLDRDLEKNEIARENALKNVNVPVLNTRVKKYVSGPVSKNRDRIVALPLVVSIDYPEGENPREIPEEVLADLGIELFDMVGADYVTPNPSLMQITDSIPSAKDVYDYESSQYAQDFASNVVFFDYGVYLDYTRLPDGKHYAPPRE